MADGAPPRTGPGGREAVAERARTPLLTLLTQEALEQDYQAVAGRKASGAAAPGWPLQRAVGVAAVLLAFGLLVTVAAVQTSRNSDVADAGRATLIGRIEGRQERVRELQQRISDLREENADAEEALLALGDDLADAQRRVTFLGAVTGYVAVSGPGIRVRLDNAPLADPETEHIRDSDLALLVDGLWQAGAEAVAVNGQRLTARSGIRNSGTPIEVNSIAIAPPYTVEAIGDPGTLAAELLETSSGLAFAGLVSQYGFSYDQDNVDDLRLPAAPGTVREPLRSVRRLDDAAGGREEEGGT